MNCPRANGTYCEESQCPMWCELAKNCLEVLALKNKLNILSQEEKQGLTEMRKTSMGIGGKR